MIKLESISKKYASQKVLENINFSADENEFVSIIGKSGVGKTTLLSILAGMVAPDSGRIIFQDQDITHFDEEQFAHFRLLNVGIVFQDFKIIPSLSAYANVYLAVHPRKDLSKQKKDEQVKNIIAQVGISHKIAQNVDDLSGGEKQRVAIARSLVGKPKLVLADEPTGNLDTETSASIMELFQKLNRELETTFIIITHDKDIADQTQKKYELTDKSLTVL
jgi:ABC-type lipoprotein export system ATPase subunit